MIKKLITFCIIIAATVFTVFAQIPAGYYDNAIGKTGTQLKLALHNIIKGHTVLTYASLHTHYQTTDKKPNGKVWDMYSDRPGSTPPYEYTFLVNVCGSYSAEGDCYNREHSFPQSWFSGTVPESDIFMVYPTDGWVNGKRSNYPYGEVLNATWTSLNGSKLGPSKTPGYSGTVFEPINAYKGDFARTYFYMAVRYYTQDSGWPGSDMVSGAEPKPWALAMLKQWHANDTVSQKEIDRNNAAYGIQNNRNPFIDHPEYVNLIWGTPTGSEEISPYESIVVSGNPGNGIYTINYFSQQPDDIRLVLYNSLGQVVFANSQVKTDLYYNKTIDITAEPGGVYYLHITGSKYAAVRKIIKT